MRALQLLILLLLTSFFGACGGPVVEEQVVTETTTSADPTIAALDARIKADSSDAKNYYARAVAHFQDKNLQLASADVIKSMELDSSFVDSYLLANTILIEANDAPGAINMLQRGLKFQPRNVELRLELAKMYFYLKQYDRSLENFSVLIKEDGSFPPAYFYRGLLLKEKGDEQGAVQNFMAALEFNPDYLEAHMQLALLHSEKKEDRAIAYFNNALRINPRSVQAWYGLGSFYQNTDRWDKAKDCYRKIMKIDPQYEFAYYNLGYIFYHSDSLELAKKHFQMAVGVSPAYANAYQMRGLCEEGLGDLEAALRDYEQALVFEEEHSSALLGITRVKKLLNKN